MEPSDARSERETLRAAPMQAADATGFVEHDGARIYYASFGKGAPVILLHGGLGNGDDWGNQAPALVANGHRAIVIDSRGHGRSTCDARPFSYDRMATDVIAVMDHLGLANAAVAGWSDGAIVGVASAMTHPSRVSRVFAFAGNMDLTGVKDISMSDPSIAAAFGRAKRDYVRLSSTPAAFDALAKAVGHMMQTEPNYSAADLARVHVPVAIVYAEHDEFIKREHAEYVARTIPRATLIVLPGVSHFAPLQKPILFNDALVGFLRAGG